MLADVVRPIPDAVPAKRSWNGIPTACHFGTCYWLFLAEFGRAPTLSEYAEFLGNPQLLIQRLLPFGQRLTRKAIQSGLVPGTIVVFVKDGAPDHSCVATNPWTLSGYNQGYIFPSGQFLQFTNNHISELRWHSGLFGKDHDQVQCNISVVEWADVVAIGESVAKAVVGHQCIRNGTLAIR
ncbi:hypothetical protein [Pandoraea sp. NPDC090278]|uniref:hypothetical protein n=1 Tax=Pandoraea sp. NPDC090278 TaxID=3364391 RepID=UPI00383BB0EF